MADVPRSAYEMAAAMEDVVLHRSAAGGSEGKDGSGRGCVEEEEDGEEEEEEEWKLLLFFLL